MFCIGKSPNIFGNIPFIKYFYSLNSTKIMAENIIKGRGAQHHTANKFLAHHHEPEDDFLNYCHSEGEEAQSNKTVFIKKPQS